METLRQMATSSDAYQRLVALMIARRQIDEGDDPDHYYELAHRRVWVASMGATVRITGAPSAASSGPRGITYRSAHVDSHRQDRNGPDLTFRPLRLCVASWRETAVGTVGKTLAPRDDKRPSNESAGVRPFRDVGSVDARRASSSPRPVRSQARFSISS